MNIKYVHFITILINLIGSACIFQPSVRLLLRRRLLRRSTMRTLDESPSWRMGRRVVVMIVRVALTLALASSTRNSSSSLGFLFSSSSINRASISRMPCSSQKTNASTPCDTRYLLLGEVIITMDDVSWLGWFWWYFGC